MPAHRLDMRLIREVLRLKYGAGLSHRAIAAALGVSVGTVSNCLGAFLRSGMGYPFPGETDDDELGRRLFRQSPAAGRARPKGFRTLPKQVSSCAIKE